MAPCVTKSLSVKFKYSYFKVVSILNYLTLRQTKYWSNVFLFFLPLFQLFGCRHETGGRCGHLDPWQNMWREKSECLGRGCAWPFEQYGNWQELRQGKGFKWKIMSYVLLFYCLVLYSKSFQGSRKVFKITSSNINILRYSWYLPGLHWSREQDLPTWSGLEYWGCLGRRAGHRLPFLH